MKIDNRCVRPHGCRKNYFIVILSILLFALLPAAGCATPSLRPLNPEPGTAEPTEPPETSAPIFLTTAPLSDATTEQEETTPSVTTETVPATTPETDIPWSQDLRGLIDSLRPPFMTGRSIPFYARILRTPPLSHTLGVSTNPLMISNRETLVTFLERVKYGWQLKDSDIRNLLDVYNNDFFHKNVLIAGAIGLNSGSIQVGVRDVLQTDDQLSVLFNFTFPEIGTMDMMSWHYFVEIAASDAAGRTVAGSYMPNVEKTTIAE